MSFSVRARAQLLLAVASGLAACQKAPASSPTDPASTSAPAQGAVTAAGLTCTDNAELDRLCVAPRTPPSTGDKGHMQDDSFSAYDANGCYAASALKGMCTGIAQANGPARVGGQCCYDVCRVPVPCGRPILIAGRQRLANVTARDDWSGAAFALRSESALRARAANAWLLDGRMEHASIAAFARLSLELMAVGASSSLVEAAHRAALEEIEHARTCFAIAAALSHEAPEQKGPASLSLGGLQLRSDLREIALEAAVHSCAGETVAALALGRAAASCAPPELRARLRKMAEEELSHAALGFRIVAWAFAELDESARDEIIAALRVPEHDAPSFEDEMEAHAWGELGRLTSTDMRQVEDDARAIVSAATEELSNAPSVRIRVRAHRKPLRSGS